MAELKTYLLKHFDKPLVRFSAMTDTPDANYQVLWVDENARQLLPFSFEASPEGLDAWVRRRNIPKNRAFANNFLAKSGMSSNRPLGILTLSKGLSLDDCYWVVEEGDTSTFAKANLYDNPISRLLAAVAFTGHGSSVRTGFSSSPEFTTNGMLPKCWRRIDGKIYLYKGGTTGAANAGFEPYSEYYAANVAQSLGFNAIGYDLHRWKGILCSSCELFTSLDYSFVPVANVVRKGDWTTVLSEYARMGPEYQEALSDMLAFDALICNTDRHLNNFGFLAKNETNELAMPAPMFDHGNSLFYQAYGEDWDSAETLAAYAETQVPCLYDDFFEGAAQVMTRSSRAKVRKAVDFSFTCGPAKGFSRKRLALIEGQIRERARRLLR